MQQQYFIRRIKLEEMEKKIPASSNLDVIQKTSCTFVLQHPLGNSGFGYPVSMWYSSLFGSFSSDNPLGKRTDTFLKLYYQPTKHLVKVLKQEIK